MRDKQQAILSWIVLILVVLALIFPIRALISYGRSPSMPSPQPTVAAMLTLVIPSPSPVAVSMAQGTPTAPIEAVFPEGPLPAAPEPSATPLPDLEEEKAKPPFRMQFGSPRYLPAFTHAGEGCSWLGIAGQVFDAEGESPSGMVIFVSGTLEGQAINFVAVTGSHAAYGPGGYEIQISDHLPAQGTALTAQLFDLQGFPISDPYAVNLPADCGQNLIMVNFMADTESVDIYLPLVAGPGQP
jgi:hypothetical protein